MARLHDRRDAEGTEPRHVVDVETLRVHHAVAGCQVAVRTSRCLEAIEGHAEPAVAGAVHMTRPPLALEFDHEFSELFGSPERVAALPGRFA